MKITLVLWLGTFDVTLAMQYRRKGYTHLGFTFNVIGNVPSLTKKCKTIENVSGKLLELVSFILKISFV